MKILNIISILLMVILLSNCDKKNKEPLYCLMQQEFKDYTVFTEGDYWVYMNNIGVKDSIVLIKQTITQETNNEVKYNYLHQLFLKNESDTFRQITNFISNRCEYNLQNNNSILFFYPAVIGNYSSMGLYQNYELKLVTILDSMEMYNKVYRDIMIFEDTISSYYDFKKIYYSRNIGLIKKEEFDGTIWELINYNVNQ